MGRIELYNVVILEASSYGVEIEVESYRNFCKSG